MRSACTGRDSIARPSGPPSSCWSKRAGRSLIFPEGIITRSNDRLGALHEGPAFIAHSAAKQRAKTEPGARTLLIPVALRYRFLGRLEESAAPVLDRIETRLTWTPRPDLPLIERLRRAGNAILGLKELELVGEFRHATIAERLARLVDDILGPLEDGVEGQEAGKRRPVAGARTLAAAILPELVEGGLSDAERERRWDQLARLYLAQQLSLYPAGYLEGHPSTERMLETVERLEEDLTDVATVHRPLAVTVPWANRSPSPPDGPRPAALDERRSRSNRNPARHSLRKRSRSRTWPCFNGHDLREAQAIHFAVTTRVGIVVGLLHLARPLPIAGIVSFRIPRG